MKNLYLNLLLVTMAMTITSQVFAASELVTNGSFEIPVNTSTTAPEHFITYSASNPLIGWTVSGEVDVVDENQSGIYRWQDAQANGVQSLDLNGLTTGSISQSLATEVGTDYYLTFSYANNPYGLNSPSSPFTGRTADVFVGGSQIANIVAIASTGPNNMNWATVTYVFKAISISTVLKFQSTNAGVGGVALDAISVSAVPEPTTMVLLGFGGIAAGIAGLRRRRAQKAVVV